MACVHSFHEAFKVLGVCFEGGFLDQQVGVGVVVPVDHDFHFAADVELSLSENFLDSIEALVKNGKHFLEDLCHGVCTIDCKNSANEFLLQGRVRVEKMYLFDDSRRGQILLKKKLLKELVLLKTFMRMAIIFG